MGLPFDQYGSFLRNHDELDLERLSEEDRQAVYREMAPREDMRIFGRGIRRRLAPILGGDQARIRLANSLLFTMPGIPIIRYGDEIGMGDDLSLPGRDSVRTSMQWNDHHNAGFSAAPRENWARTLISEGPYGNARVNVADQRRDPDSLLNWFARIVRIRLEMPEFGSGEPEHVETGDPALFAHRCRQRNSSAIAVHNLSDRKKKLKLNLDREELDLAMEMFADGRYRQLNQETGELELNPYGYRWFRVSRVTL